MRRVQRDKSKELAVEALAKSGSHVFPDIWQLLLFCAAVGFKRNHRIPIASFDGGKSMPQSYFEGSPAWPGFKYLLSIVEDQDPGKLSANDENDDFHLTLFEEYANGGLDILIRTLEASSYSIDALISFIASEISLSDTQKAEPADVKF